MTASLGLYRLQQVDRSIDQARAQLESIRKQLENDTELRGALAEVEQADSDFRQIKLELSGAEAEAERQKIKIQDTEASLYGGNVRNPKELADLQLDVASLKKHLSVLEERQLDSMLAAEQAESNFGSKRTILEALRSRRGGEHEQLLERKGQLKGELDRLAEERGASINSIDAGLLAAYDDLRTQKRGVAVTEISDGVCGACGTGISASLQQTAKSSAQLAHCPTCGRILYPS